MGQERLQLSPKASQLVRHRRWLERELELLQRLKLKHEKATTLQGRIIKHADCWLVFVKDARVPPTKRFASEIEVVMAARDWRRLCQSKILLVVTAIIRCGCFTGSLRNRRTK